MIKVGIIGFGFMGAMHLRCYRMMKNVRVAAICDIDGGKFSNSAGTSGNIAGADGSLDLGGIGLYTDAAEMLARADLDAVSVTLPTYLHCSCTLDALKAGLHVFCEKPMALSVSECRKMADAAERAGKRLQVGHCIRFWPEYAKAKEIVDSGRYGRVLAATFRRLSATPTWSWDGWLMDGAKSGGAALDLHIHDSDFVQYLFGMPLRVFSRGTAGPSGEVDHIVSSYVFDDDKVVTAEGGWAMMPGYGFRMSFDIVLERATLSFDSAGQPPFRLAPDKGAVRFPKVAAGDGYSLELRHWVTLLHGRPVPSVITPEDSLRSVELVTAERTSCAAGKAVTVR